MLLAAVAGSASGVGPGQATLRPGPASEVFTVALTLVALFAAASIAVLIRFIAAPRLPDIEGGSRRRSTLADRLKAVASVAAFVAIWMLLFLGHHPHQVHPRAAPAAGGRSPSSAFSLVRFSAPAAGATVAVVLALVVLAVGVPAWRRRRWVRARGPLAPMPKPGPPHPAAAADLGPDALPAAVSTVTVPDPDHEPDPRRAIVAAYVAMTEAAARCGVARSLDETASEYLHRVLGVAGAPPAPTRRLTDVFERARYSTETIGEDGRMLAIACLADIRAGVGVSA